MQRQIIFLCVLLFASTFFLSAQDNKLRIAIFDPAISGSSFDEGTGVIIREMVSTVIVNSGKYIIIERSLIDRVLREQNFSNSGAVDDSQISQIGKLAGANKVILSVLSSSGNRGLLSLKMIDVESATIENQKAQVVELSKIFDIIDHLALEVIGENATTPFIIQENTRQSLSTSENTINTDNTDKSHFTTQTNRKENEDFLIYTILNTADEDCIVLSFTGYPFAKRNQTAQIYVDGRIIGTGTLQDGFAVYFQDIKEGKHNVRIIWSDADISGSYTIDTRDKKYFSFRYEKPPFGFQWRLKMNN